ncbi:MAG: T9SS type A sorting domain-containing protein, partial [Bacteroidota bacterium]
QAFETICSDSLGKIELSVNGLGAPFTYHWSHGDSVKDPLGLLSGNYQVTVANTLGDTVVADFFVPSSDIPLTYSIDPADCDSSNGSIDLSVGGNLSSYSYLWSTGDTTQDISGLSPGGYSVDVFGDSACVNRAVMVLDELDSCSATLSGEVYIDQNGNCQRDPNEAALPNVLVTINPGGGVITNQNGAFSFEVPVGVYQVTCQVPTYLQSNCAGNSYTLNVANLSDDKDFLDFPLNAPPAREMVAFQQVNQFPVPGQSRRYHLFASNQGGIPINGDVNWYYDASMVSITYMDPVGDTLTPGVIRWPYSGVAPNTSQVFRVDVIVDTLATIGDSITSRLEVFPLSGDIDKPNNRDTLVTPVLNSFDPNDKLVTPAGVGPFGLIPPGDLTHQYTVRFQNTGTFAASTVLIRDTLDAKLDPVTLTVLGQSHHVQTRIIADSILIFLFENINLPDSASDPVGSMGFVTFEIDRLPNLPLGTQIRNRAAIFFDYNPPIITNEVINTLYRFPSLAVSLPDEFCEEEPLVARVTQGFPPFRYTWNGVNDGSTDARRDTLLLSESGWYRLSITDSFDVTLQDSFLIEVAPLPEVSFTYQFQTDSSDRLVAFTSSLQDTDEVLWDFGDGTQSNELNPVHLFPIGDNYLVTLSASNACGTRIDSQSIGVVSGIGNWADDLTLYPNPGQETITLLGLANQSYVLTLQDLRGREIWVESGAAQRELEIDRKGLPAGLYLLNVQTDQGSAVMKLRWE